MERIITQIPTCDVYPNPRNNRDALNGIEELAANIAENGLLSPITVVPDGQVYFIVAGHRRHAAVQSLGLATIEAIVTDWSELDAVKRIVADNASTDPLSPLERSRGIQTMLATGVPPQAAAASAGESVERVERAARGLKAVADPVAAEDLTIERLIAIADVEDPEEAKRLINAPEAQWANIYRDIIRKRQVDQAEDEARAIVEASGVPLVPHADPDTMRYLSRGTEAPEGAIAAVLQRDWSTCHIIWYGEATEDHDPEAEAKRAAEAAKEDARIQAAYKRHEFIMAYLAGNTPGASNALRDYAVNLFDTGTPADPRNLAEAMEGQPFLTRIYASLLGYAGVGAAGVGRGNTWYDENYGAAALAYFAALIECGYEVSEAEQALIASLEEEK